MEKPTIEINCHGCQRPFKKLLAEYNRRQKLGGNHFCSTKCANIYNHSKIDWKELHSVKIKKDSIFHYLLGHILRRKIGKKQECHIDVPYLKEIWETQQGIC